MTGSDRVFVAWCFIGMTLVLGVVQITEGEAMRTAIENARGSSEISFPSSMDVMVKNDQPIPVEVHQPQTSGMPLGMDATEPLEVKVVNRPY